MPESLADRVRLIDLADDGGAPGINLLDTRIFADRDRTADSVVRVMHGLWEQWGPRMQSILEHTVKTLHEANEQMDEDRQYTILDGLRLISDVKFRGPVLEKVKDPYILEWWARDFGSWRRETRADALAPVQTRLAYYASSKKARAILGQSRSTIDLRETILEGGVLLVSTAQGSAGRDVSALVGASLLNLVDSVVREQEGLPMHRRRGALVVVDEMQSMPGVDYESMLSELGKYGASFILATQSLAKLEDLSRTMQDTLLANVGCLAVFQVSGSDARRLVWELGPGPGQRGRHHVFAGAPVLRARHRGDRPDGRLLHEGAEAGSRETREVAGPHPRGRLRLPVARRANRRRRGRGPPPGRRVPPDAGRYAGGAGGRTRRGRTGRVTAARKRERRDPRSRQGEEQWGGRRMSAPGCESEVLRRLAEMPFLDRLDLAAVSGWSRGAVYQVVTRLEGEEMVQSVPHGTESLRPARRYCLTAAGVQRLARNEGTTVDEVLRRRPVSEGWRRILLERLDAVGASSTASPPPSPAPPTPSGFRWYRAGPLGCRCRPPRRADRGNPAAGSCG